MTSVAMGISLGWLIGYFEATPEMLSRTQPNLIDLLVAVLAGFAGAYALVDEKISPALPGVAISTAIVPPLANSGLCFSIGEISGGMGSFLLFLANFLSILLVASATFIASGMAKIYGERPSQRDYIKRFGLAIIAFIIITILFTGALVRSIKDRYIYNRIHAMLKEELMKIPLARLEGLHHYFKQNQLYLLANVSTPSTIPPSRVKTIQENIAHSIDMPTQLTIRSIRTSNVTAQGAAIYGSALELDGTFGRPVESSHLRIITIAEQILREKIEDQHAVYFHRAELLRLRHRNIIKAYISSLHMLGENQVSEIEQELRKATNFNNLELIIQNIPEKLQSSGGKLRYGWFLGEKATPERLATIKKIKSELSAAFKNDDGFKIININVNYLDAAYHFLLEVVGPTIYPQEKLNWVKKHLAEKFNDTIVELYVWSRPEVVLTPEGAMPFKEVYQSFAKRQRENLPDEMMPMIESSAY
jgi:uncharacterized membrane protein